MTKEEDERDRALLASWHQAQRGAERGENMALIELLRSLSPCPSNQTHEVPNLWFIADVLEGKFRTRRGRPRGDRISGENDREIALSGMWKLAECRAKRGGNAALIELLRCLSLRVSGAYHEVPNLWFIADVLEGKFRTRRGRPRGGKILSGLIERQIANAVESTRKSEGVSIETAVAKVKDKVHKSESTTHKAYFRAKKAGLIKTRRRSKSA